MKFAYGLTLLEKEICNWRAFFPLLYFWQKKWSNFVFSLVKAVFFSHICSRLAISSLREVSWNFMLFKTDKNVTDNFHYINKASICRSPFSKLSYSIKLWFCAGYPCNSLGKIRYWVLTEALQRGVKWVR